MTETVTSDNRDEIQTIVSESVRERLESQEPGEDEKAKLRDEHDGHLVRDTTSQLQVDGAEVGPGVEAETTAQIPDTYCFTCEEWVGFSGVELRGTPRSRREAYYLGGMPQDVLSAKNGTAETLTELADALIERVGHIDTRSDAYEFVETELETLVDVE